jgi:hypothetical protein
MRVHFCIFNFRFEFGEVRWALKASSLKCPLNWDMECIFSRWIKNDPAIQIAITGASAVSFEGECNFDCPYYGLAAATTLEFDGRCTLTGQQPLRTGDHQPHATADLT